MALNVLNVTQLGICLSGELASEPPDGGRGIMFDQSHDPKLQGPSKCSVRGATTVSSVARHIILALAAIGLLGCAVSARADSYKITFTSGIVGALNLNAMAQGGGSFLVTGVTGSENGLAVGGIIAPNSSGFFAMPNGNGFSYDDKLFPTSLPVFDNAGLLFTLIGPNGTSIFENLYSIGSSFYLESAYLNNGARFPWDFSYVPVTFTLTDSPPVTVTPEPPTLVLCLSGLVVLALAMFKKVLA